MRAIFVARHAEREDYAWKARDDNWQAQAERPWDTPLTKAGHAQAAALGRAVAGHCERLGLAPVTEIRSSPLLRCGQTSSGAARVLGVKRLLVEPGLAETMSEDWYRSWAIHGADSTWGGPTHSKAGTPVAKGSLHAAALRPAAEIYDGTDALLRRMRAHGDSWVEEVSDSVDSASAIELLTYTWESPETEEEQTLRMRLVCERLRASNFGGTEGSVLMLTHGGPTGALYCALTTQEKAPNCGYCGLYAYRPLAADLDASGVGWEALVVADHDHLEEVPEATRGGPNDLEEQTPANDT